MNHPVIDQAAVAKEADLKSTYCFCARMHEIKLKNCLLRITLEFLKGTMLCELTRSRAAFEFRVGGAGSRGYADSR